MFTFISDFFCRIHFLFALWIVKLHIVFYFPFQLCFLWNSQTLVYIQLLIFLFISFLFRICSNTGTYLENVHAPYLCALRCPTVRYCSSYDYSSCSCSYSSVCCCKRHLPFAFHAPQQFERLTVDCHLRVWHYSMQKSLLALPPVCCTCYQ